MRCPKCGTVYPDDPDANFCELDGTPLVSDAEYARLQGNAPTLPIAVIPVPGCTLGQCADDGDGYCAACGRKMPPAVASTPPGIATPSALAPTPFLGAVTDRGKRHPTNQDNVAVTIETVDEMPVPIIVVCDGVSSARHSEETAAEAVRVALAHLQQFVQSRGAKPISATSSIDPAAETVADLQVVTPGLLADSAITPDSTHVPAPFAPLEENDSLAAMREAIIAAHQAVCALDDAPDDTLDPPGCTIVAGIVEPSRITIGWVGDSRAYLLAGDDSHLLTRDHSYVNELIERGEMTEEEAAHSQYAHVITLCLGPLNSDADHPPEPSLVQIPRASDGLLTLCSDGLWNYAPDAAHMAKLAREAGGDADAQTIARHLVTYANTQAGLDNITAAIVRLGDLPPPALLDTPTPQHPNRPERATQPGESEDVIHD